MSSLTTPLRTVLRARASLPAAATAATRPLARAAPTTTATRRQLHQSRPSALPYKDDQDRESLKPKSNDYSKSGSDDDVAAQGDAAFNPDKTSPEAAKDAAGAGSGGNPLDTSPADKGTAEAGRGAEEDTSKTASRKSSGGGEAPKDGKVV